MAAGERRQGASRWPEPVERVAAFLRGAGAEARLEQLGAAVPTASEAAQAVGSEPGRIVKSLVLVCDGEPVVALVPGDCRADLAKVARSAGAGTARVATPAEVVAATGFDPGGVAPFPLPDVSRVLLERTLLSGGRLWVGAGSDRHLVALAPSELVRLSRARAADLVRESGIIPPHHRGEER